MSHEMRTRCLTTLALLLLHLPNALAAQLTANANVQVAGERIERNSSHLPEGVGKFPSINGAKVSGRFSRIHPCSRNPSSVIPLRAG